MRFQKITSMRANKKALRRMTDIIKLPGAALKLAHNSADPLLDEFLKLSRGVEGFERRYTHGVKENLFRDMRDLGEFRRSRSAVAEYCQNILGITNEPTE